MFGVLVMAWSSMTNVDCKASLRGLILKTRSSFFSEQTGRKVVEATSSPSKILNGGVSSTGESL